ncbi:hypothetical protein ACH5RR_012485 [Cinchona calisaya]|uniref:Uncharacterized protein n=1 Tax=Cinchona calisaya TaxID=153742 RepID=A0ABD3A7Y6_9GENT
MILLAQECFLSRNQASNLFSENMGFGIGYLLPAKIAFLDTRVQLIREYLRKRGSSEKTLNFTEGIFWSLDMRHRRSRMSLKMLL